MAGRDRRTDLLLTDASMSYDLPVYEVAYSKQALNALRKLPTNDARRIRARIADYAAEPDARAHQVMKLKGREGFRLRVGNWRALFDVNGDALEILEIRSRGSVYR